MSQGFKAVFEEHQATKSDIADVPLSGSSEPREILTTLP
jgi:hypothetical protein